MALQLYTNAIITWNGSTLAEESSVTVDVVSNAQEVTTVSKGFAGLSPGAPKITVKIESAVPFAGFELNPGKYVRTLTVGELSVFAASAQLTSKGFITDYSFTHAVNQDSRLSLTFIGEPVDFQ